MNHRLDKINFSRGRDLTIPDFYNLSNATNLYTDELSTTKRLAGVYGSVDLGYKDFVYLTVTGRNDWASSFGPQAKSSFFYPAVSLSFVPTELMPKNDVLDYAKLRLSYAVAGPQYLRANNHVFNNKKKNSMKKLSYIFVAVLLMASGCKKFVEGYDVSPNSPVDVPINLLLPSVEVATFAMYTGQLARVTAVFMKQQKGRQFQYEEYERYDFNEGDVDGDWWTLYDGSLINAQLLIEKSGDANPHYRGIGRILKAMNLGIATDFWGDIPDKEALQGLKGPEFFNAAHDAQEQVIANIQKLLDDAIVDLKTADDKNILMPGDDDYVFGGNANKWVATAYVIKARYANRLSKNWLRN